MTLTSDDLFTFSGLLKTFRKRRRLTQQQLAEAVGIHRITLVRWEQGDSLLHQAVPLVSSEDHPLQEFLEQCCEQHSRAWCRSADLWQAYEQWVKTTQERYPLSRKAFTQQIKAAGCRTDRTNRARIWRGVALVEQETVTGSDRQ